MKPLKVFEKIIYFLKIAHLEKTSDFTVDSKITSVLMWLYHKKNYIKRNLFKNKKYFPIKNRDRKGNKNQVKKVENKWL